MLLEKTSKRPGRRALHSPPRRKNVLLVDGRESVSEDERDRMIANSVAQWGDAYYYYCSGATEEVRDITPNVRLLPYRDDQIPSFGRLDIAVLCESPAHLSLLRNHHPEATLITYAAHRERPTRDQISVGHMHLVP